MAAPRFLIPVLALSNFLIGIGAFVIVGLLEPLGADMNISATAAGQLMTVYALGYAVLSPLLVSLTGRIGRRRVMAAGLVVFSLAALVSALAPSLFVLNLARILAAAGAGVFTPVAAATAAALYPEAQRARVLAMIFFGLTIAQVLGVPAGSWIAYTFGWRWAFWGVVILALPCIILIWQIVPAGLRFQPVSLRDLRQVMRNARMMLAVLFTASFIGTIYVVSTYIAPLLSTTMGYGRDGITAILLLFGVGAVIGNIASGIMTDRLGWQSTLTTLCLGQILLLPGFSLLPMPDIALFALVLIWSVCGWAFMAAQQTRLIGASASQAPVVLALNAAAIYVGAAGGSAIGGAVIAVSGLKALGMVGALCAVMALVHLRVSIRTPPEVSR